MCSSDLPGTVVSGQLNPASETAIYQFDALAGDQFYFDRQESAYNTHWRLLDPDGRAVFGPRYMSYGDIDVTTFTLLGVYTLLIEGYSTDTGTRDYSFNVEYRGNEPQVLPSGTPITIGTHIADIITVSDEQDHYSFTLAENTSLYFDSMTRNSSLNWSLVGPDRKSVV